MIQINEEELFQYLMNSDFHEEYSPEEYKFLLNKWRYYYRLLHGQHTRLKDDLQNKLDNIEKERQKCSKIIEESNEKVNLIESKIEFLINRKLTWSERFKGKIKKENEDQ